VFPREKKQDTKEEKIEQTILKKYNSYYRMAMSFVHNEADAADIVQEGAYKAIKNSDSLKHIGLYKEQYEKPVMNDTAVFEMKQRMEQGKKEKRSMSKKKSYKGWIIAASVALAIFILPNTSKAIAYAMGDIPILGEFFKVITFRNYKYEDEKNIADVVVPEVTTEENVDKTVAETAKKTADEINAEIRDITDKWVEEFKSNMEDEGRKWLRRESFLYNRS
jgi:hypothetical protein